MAAFNSSDLDLEIDLFETTISLSPDYAEAYNYLGQAHLKKENIKTQLIASRKL